MLPVGTAHASPYQPQIAAGFCHIIFRGPCRDDLSVVLYEVQWRGVAHPPKAQTELFIHIASLPKLEVFTMRHMSRGIGPRDIEVASWNAGPTCIDVTDHDYRFGQWAFLFRILGIPHAISGAALRCRYCQQ